MSLDQGLDAIIASSSISSGGRRFRPRNNRSKTGGNKVGKPKSTDTRRTAPAPASFNPLNAAKRAVVNNMPLDVSEKDVKDFFSGKIGRIRKIEGVYRENGKPTGTYTITFEKAGHALKLSEQFNNEPIDGGKSKLVVQILLDAIPTSAKPLSERIGAQVGKQTGKQAGKLNQKGKSNKSSPKKASADKKPKAKGSKKEPVRKARTAAELDAEMSDYFAKAADISV